MQQCRFQKFLENKPLKKPNPFFLWFKWHCKKRIFFWDCLFWQVPCFSCPIPMHRVFRADPAATATPAAMIFTLIPILLASVILCAEKEKARAFFAFPNFCFVEPAPADLDTVVQETLGIFAAAPSVGPCRLESMAVET